MDTTVRTLLRSPAIISDGCRRRHRCLMVRCTEYPFTVAAFVDKTSTEAAAIFPLCRSPERGCADPCSTNGNALLETIFYVTMRFIRDSRENTSKVRWVEEEGGGETMRGRPCGS
jgi:hypothetical protein